MPLKQVLEWFNDIGLSEESIISTLTRFGIEHVEDLKLVEMQEWESEMKPKISLIQWRRFAIKLKSFRETPYAKDNVVTAPPIEKVKQGEPKQEEPNKNQLTIHVQTPHSGKLTFRIKPTTKLGKVIKACQQKLGILAIRLLVDGKRVGENDLAKDYDLEDEDQLDLLIEAVGGFIIIESSCSF